MTITRDSYLKIRSPIEKELKMLFNTSERLTIFDIGSCEGLDSIKYSRLFPNAKIYAVEVLPSNLTLIQENLANYSIDNVKIIPLALSDKKGQAQFFVSSGSPNQSNTTEQWNYGNKSSSLLAPDRHLEIFPWLQFNNTITVETDRLDNICQEHQIKQIDFIHMDVQGAELKILQGATRILKKTIAIWLEVEAVSLYKGQPLKTDVEHFFKRNNFYKVKDTVNQVSGDQLYINLKYFPEHRMSYFLLIGYEKIAQLKRKIKQKIAKFTRL